MESARHTVSGDLSDEFPQYEITGNIANSISKVYEYLNGEGGVVDGYKKIEDKFVNTFLTHEGETAEDAKKRLAEEAAARKKAEKEAAEKRAAANPVNVSNSGKISVDVGKNI